MTNVAGFTDVSSLKMAVKGAMKAKGKSDTTASKAKAVGGKKKKKKMTMSAEDKRIAKRKQQFEMGY